MKVLFYLISFLLIASYSAPDAESFSFEKVSLTKIEAETGVILHFTKNNRDTGIFKNRATINYFLLSISNFNQDQKCKENVYFDFVEKFTQTNFYPQLLPTPPPV